MSRLEAAPTGRDIPANECLLRDYTSLVRKWKQQNTSMWWQHGPCLLATFACLIGARFKSGIMRVDESQNLNLTLQPKRECKNYAVLITTAKKQLYKGRCYAAVCKAAAQQLCSLTVRTLAA
jgi:hypothetical protein